MVTASYLLVYKWDFTALSCFPAQQTSLTTVDCVGRFAIPEQSGEVSMGSGWRQCERAGPLAKRTAVRALSLPPSFSTSGPYMN